MPPAPITATRFPGTTAPLSTSAYDTTVGWSMPVELRGPADHAGRDDHLVVRREVGRRGLRAEPDVDAEDLEPAACSSAASRGSPPCPAPASRAGTGRRARSDFSKRVTAKPRSAAETAAADPAGPAPTTATDRARRVGPSSMGSSTSVVSRQARGLTRQDAFRFWNTWSRQAWLQAMQVLISSARPAAALATKSGSASSGRAIETRSASPAARIASASSGVLIRFEAQTGTDTSALSRAVAERQAPGGTWVMIVGTRASCQPMPVLSTVTPASSSRCARSSDLVPGLAALDQVEQRDPVDDREVLADQLPGPAHDLDREAHPLLGGAAPRVGAVVGAGGEELVDQVALGAHDLDRVVARLRGRARRSARSRSRCGRRPGVDSALGRNGVIGDFCRDAETLNGW